MATTDNRIGNDLNTWREPVFTLADDEGWLKNGILLHHSLENINEPSIEYKEHCETVDAIIASVLRGIKKYVKYDGLIIHDYVKQGSCREGLKVNDALEFDCLLLFEISDMMIVECHVLDHNDDIILGLVKLKVTNGEYLCRTYPWLHSKGILEKRGYYKDEFYLNTNNLLEKVFKSIIDQTCSKINIQLPEGRFALRRSANPPTLNLTITVDNNLVHIRELYSLIKFESLVNKPLPSLALNIDIVPAIILRRDTVPDPYTVYSQYGGRELECPVFAVMKGANNIRESSRTADHEYLWRESACGYEKLILDIGRRNPSQRYLMTACRIVKSCVDWLKENKPQEDQLHRVAVSYYLKNILFHCIALLTIPSKINSLSGVQEALGYFLCFLGLCIKTRNLPHFFYGNPWLSLLFPNCSFLRMGGMKKNLYHSDRIKDDTFKQATIGFNNLLQNLKGFYTEFDQLDQDRVGLFKELLGLQHVYTRKEIVLEKRTVMNQILVLDQRPFPERWRSFCRFSVFSVVMSVAIAVIAYSLWMCFM